MQRVVVETAGWIRTHVGADAVEVSLTYEPTDPYAVTVRVHADTGTTTWTFARDLLADGLRSMVPLGEGQVRVQATSVLTEISRTDDAGTTTVLRLPWWNTREFVRLSQAVVARGEEEVDVDSWLAAMTGSEG
ncbi:SsgA family sporulation/cell division regulator [Nocardioides caldifontis]|uniref:SsgA family sporulation/cell division regulator n=1 Tax=Nocardioides caldifontis TaxID=2588938 RepID=UPI0011DFC37A|nr:SsgA family sporulation/cell division regulator [Nocardioides caldifontis]